MGKFYSALYGTQLGKCTKTKQDKGYRKPTHPHKIKVDKISVKYFGKYI